MAEYAFRFWFNDQDHIRSPFPDYIQSELKQISGERFQEWLDALHMDASDEVDEEMMAEKFEQIMFESAVPMIKTEDERISLLYPFMPRTGDQFMMEEDTEMVIVDRLLKKEDEFTMFCIICEDPITKQRKEKTFEVTI